jgi:Tfp pilus assembly protein PilP
MLKARVAHTPRDAAAAAAVLLLSALGLVACGESAQEKAHAQVCDARKAISQQVTKLQGLTLSSSSVDEAKSGVESIGTELKKIRDAQPDLAPDRKQEVETATSRFGEELKAVGVQVASSLTSGTSESAIAAAKPKLKAAAEALASDYRQALGPISC